MQSTTPDNFNLGSRYQQLREQSHISQRELAEKAQVAPLTIFRIEHGRNASLSVLHRIAHSMGYELNINLTKIKS